MFLMTNITKWNTVMLYYSSSILYDVKFLLFYIYLFFLQWTP